MLRKPKDTVQRLKEGEPGDRFQRLNRRQESGRNQPQPRWAYIAAGSVLVIAGIVLGIPPGMPGFVLVLVGLALIAMQSRPMASALDHSEAVLRRPWQRVSARQR